MLRPPAGRRFRFKVRLASHLAIGRRGPVPVEAMLNRPVERLASLVPKALASVEYTGPERAGYRTGDDVRVELLVPENYWQSN